MSQGADRHSVRCAAWRRVKKGLRAKGPTACLFKRGQPRAVRPRRRLRPAADFPAQPGPTAVVAFTYESACVPLGVVSRRQRGGASRSGHKWVAAGLDTESEASRLHFWGNTAVLSVFEAGRDLARRGMYRGRKVADAHRIDRNTQRCLQISLARRAALAGCGRMRRWRAPSATV